MPLVSSPSKLLDSALVSWLAPQLPDLKTLLGTFTVNTTSEVLTVSKAHGLTVGQLVWLTTATTLPAPGSAAVPYFVKTVPSATTLTLSATRTGATVNFTTTGTGTHSLHRADIYEGRFSGTLAGARSLVVSAPREGGALVDQGIYDVMVELQIMTNAAPQSGETVAPVAWHENLIESLAYLFRSGQQATVVAALAVIDATFATPGWWIEPRVEQSTDSHFVTHLPLTWSVSIAP